MVNVKFNTVNVIGQCEINVDNAFVWIYGYPK